MSGFLPLRRGLGLLLVLALGALFLLPRLDALVVNREQELRVVLTSRAMAEGGSWLVPQYLGEPRLRKPPLLYWVTAGAYRLAGSTASATVARLPVALSGIALAALLYGIGAQMMGRRRGLIAALVCVSSFIVLRQGRLAETDVPLTLFTTLGLYAGYRALRAPPGWSWWLLAGAAAGLGFLIKGPAALALPLLAWIAFACLPPRRRDAWLNPAPLAALVLFALLALPWYGFIFQHGRSGAEAQLSRELSATFAETHHPGPLLYYTYSLLHAAAPWGVVLPFALWGLWRARRGHAAPAMLLAWFATSFLALTATSSKQIHYATLLIPPTSLAIGWLLGFARHRGPTPRARVARGLLVVLLVALALGAVALAVYARRAPELDGRVPVALLALLAGLAALSPLLRPLRFPRMACAVASMLFIHAALAHLVLPQRKEQRVLAETLLAAREDVRAAPRVFSSGASRPIVEFYAGRAVVPADSPRDAWRRATQGDVVVSAFRRGPGEPLPAWPGEPLASGQREGLYCDVRRKR